MAENQIAYNASAPEAATHEPASPLNFNPVALRHRIDGWTPEKQREYVEALADTGVARQAAAMVGMTEQSVNRLRRRADARSFDHACALAMRHGARRLVSVAFERAIEGTIKGRYYHGELVSEERVYDNRLLIALIGKLGPLLEPQESRPAADEWQPWMEAIEQGRPEPPPPPAPAGDEADEADEWDGSEVWQMGDDDTWWTGFPPPPDFDGEESEDALGRYCRTLTDEEQAVIDADLAEQGLTEDDERARRDRYFGFTPEAPRGSAAGAAGAAQATSGVAEGRPTSGEASWIDGAALPRRPEPLHGSAADAKGGAQAAVEDGKGRPTGSEASWIDGAALPRRPEAPRGSAASAAGAAQATSGVAEGRPAGRPDTQPNPSDDAAWPRRDQAERLFLSQGGRTL